MRITKQFRTETITISCTSEELRQSQTLSDAFYNAMRGAFTGPVNNDQEEDPEEDE